MKRLFLILALMITGVAGLASAPAMARGHVGVGFYFGGPGYYGGYGPGWGPGWGGPYYGYGYGYPYYGPRYYYPPPVVYADPPPYVQQAPASTTYVEQAPAQAQQAPAPQQDNVTDNEGDNSWYYCEAQKKYYPYVKSCATGWTRVPARPDDSR